MLNLSSQYHVLKRLLYTSIFSVFIIDAFAVELKLENSICHFETETLKGKICDGRFIGFNQVIHKPTGTIISGNGKANRHGLLSLYRIFTRNHRYGDAAYNWKERSIEIKDKTVLMKWPATAQRPFAFSAVYSFPAPNKLNLEVTVSAQKELTDFEVLISSYFDKTFPKAEVIMADGRISSSPRELGFWHAFPFAKQAKSLITDGRWQQGIHPVTQDIRENVAYPMSFRRHESGLTALISAKPQDCFAVYTAYDGEHHYSNYKGLFGKTIKAGASSTANISLEIGNWTNEEILKRSK